jgi:hypothetical protein
MGSQVQLWWADSLQPFQLRCVPDFLRINWRSCAYLGSRKTCSSFDKRFPKINRRREMVKQLFIPGCGWLKQVFTSILLFFKILYLATYMYMLSKNRTILQCFINPTLLIQIYLIFSSKYLNIIRDDADASDNKLSWCHYVPPCENSDLHRLVLAIMQVNRKSQVLAVRNKFTI